MSEILAYVAAASLFAWGVSHLVPTKRVVSGFGLIGFDNRQIITMEWIAESLAFVFVAVLVASTALTGAPADTAALIYRVSAGFLVGIGVLTTLTAARTEVVWFKACPVVMGVSALLLVTASFLV
jgi:hypothetical protein